MTLSPPLVFSLTADSDFAGHVAGHAGAEHGSHKERAFEDGEHKIRPTMSVRERDIYLVQSLYGSPEQAVSDKLIRVLFLLGALRDAGAARLTMVAPYLGYSRKDRRTKPRDPVTTRYIAQLFEAMTIDRFVTLDVHNVAAFQNAFRCPNDMLETRHALIDAWLGHNPSPERLCVASPDVGGVKRADAFRESLERRLGQEIPLAFMEKKRSEGRVTGKLVAGDVEGRTVLVVDDLIASGTTMTRAARAFLEHGAAQVHALATHGLFSEHSDTILATDDLSRLMVSNTVPPFRLRDSAVRDKLDVIDVTPLLGEAIRRLHTGGSLVELAEGGMA